MLNSQSLELATVELPVVAGLGDELKGAMREVTPLVCWRSNHAAENFARSNESIRLQSRETVRVNRAMNSEGIERWQ